MNKIIKQIINNKTNCFFISPHLDDAALSAGELMSLLATYTRVTVVNVFSASEKGIQTLSARKAVADSGFSSAKDLYKARIKEDQLALSSIGVKVINLGITEALWRKKPHAHKFIESLGKILPEVKHVYPTYRLHISKGKVSPQDNELINQIAGKLKRIIPKNAQVFCPVGVGDHVDHVATRKVVEKYFKPIYWLDQPYLIRLAETEKLISKLEPVFNFTVNKKSKNNLLAFYKTQIGLLFGGKEAPVLEEKFFIQKKAKVDGLPETVAGYKIVDEIYGHKKPRHFTYGLYQNKKGQKAFAKQWAGDVKNRYYGALLNEVKVYQILSKILTSDKSLSKKFPNVRIPKLLDVYQDNNQLLLLIEYIEGDQLVGFSNSQKRLVYQELFELLSYFGTKLTNTGKQQMVKRQNWFWALIMISVSLKVIWKYPRLIGYILLANLVWLTKILGFLADKKIGFIQRDLCDWNILMKDKRAFVYDFQLACLANPTLEYAVFCLKSWQDNQQPEYSIEVVKPFIKDKKDWDSFILFSLCLAVYDLSLVEGGPFELALSFLKYTLNECYRLSWIEKPFRLTRSLWREFKLFWQTPKNYLYLFMISNHRKIRIKPYDPKLEIVANEIIDQVHQALPDLKVRFIGSAKLRILGQKDIDLFVESSSNNFGNYLPKLKELFGTPKKIRNLFVEWNFKIEGCNIELSLVDPAEVNYQGRLRVHQVLKNNKDLLTEYEDLKKDLNGLPEREYIHRRMEFFNKIDRLEI